MSARPGSVLTPIRHGRLRDLEKIDYGNPGACRTARYARDARTTCRSVSRLENEAVLDRMAERLTNEARDCRPSARDRRAPVRQHQAMDEPGRVPDARPRKRSHRVQPDGARLQFAPRAQHPGRRADDGGASGVKIDAALARSAPPEPVQAAPGSTQAPIQPKKPKRSVSRGPGVRSPQRNQFSHGLLDFWTHRASAVGKRLPSVIGF